MLNYILNPITKSFKILFGVAENEETVDVVVRYRIKHALVVLFECMSDARRFIAFDEMQDLIRNDRIAQSGGQEVFDYLAYLFVIHIVNSQRVQGICAGSSNYLLRELNKTIAHGSRLYCVYIQDFDKPIVHSHSENTLHIPADVATYFIDKYKCGTRLRLLQRCARISNLAEAQSEVAAQDITTHELVKQFYALSRNYPELLVTMKSLGNGESM